MSYDAIIIGAGLNGLVAGIYLAKAGWKVLILERNAVPGGAMQTTEATLPRFKHDLFATNLSLFAGSPFHQEFAADLVRHGLAFAPAQHTFSSVFPDDTWLGVSTDIEETVSSLGLICPKDGKRWRDMHRQFPAQAEKLFPMLGERIPSFGMARVLLRNLHSGGRRWLQDTAELLLSSPREFVETNFNDRRTQSLAAAWGMHLDFAPDIAGGALYSYLECMTNQTFGMVIGKGGAATAVNAMSGLFRELGGELRLDSEVSAIHCADNVACGVELVGGERLNARRALIANLTPFPLFNKLVGRAQLPESFLNKLDRFRYGPGTMMIHLALSALPDWKAGEAVKKFPYVHIGPFMEDMSRTYNESMAGLLPSSPMLVVAQPTVIDPSRAPDRQHVLSVQVRTLPAVVKGDAAASIEGSDWDGVKEAYADRVIGKIAEYAPGIDSLILGRAVLSPKNLEDFNPSLVGGCNVGGSMHLRQNFFLRPFTGWSNYKTPIKNLYMVGAGTWPGGGTGAGSGRLLGKMLAT